MANVKINDLAVIADPASTDVLPIVDVTLDTTNKISIADILKTVPAGTASAASIAFEGDSNTGIYHPGSEQIGFTTSGSEAVRIDSAGNVGIGTTNPNNLLKVYGGRIEVQTDTSLSATDSSVFNIKTGSTGGSLFTIRAENTADNNSNWEIKTNTNEQLKFTVGASESLRIDSSGRLLVGTSSAITTANATLLQLADSAGARIVLGRNNENASAGNRIGQFDFLSNATDGTYDTCATIRCEADDDFTDDSKPSILNFSTTASGASSPTERLRIDSSGNVGIGETDPQAKLDVNGDALINGMNVGLGAGGYASNIAFGDNTFTSNTTGLFNIAIGQNSLQSNTEGVSNTGVGQGTLVNNTIGDNNVAIGQVALNANTEGSANTAVGRQALNSNITGSLNTAIGRNAGRYIEGSNNTILGAYQGTTADATLNDTVIIAAGATERLRIDSSGNVGIGTDAPAKLLDVNGDASINGLNVGRGAGDDSTNTSVGSLALNANTTGGANTAVGRLALQSNTEGSQNTALGQLALNSNITGENNTALGTGALINNTTGDLNTAVGRQALNSNITGSFNTAVGRNAGRYVGGDNNTILGAYQGTTADATLSNTVIISAGTTERLRIDSSGNVGIGSTNPQAALDINAAASTSPFIASIDGSEAARIDSSGRLLVGTSSSLGNVGGAEPVLQIADNSVNAAFCFARFTTNSSGPSVILAKAKSATIGTFTSVQDSDELGKVVFAGADGTNATSIGAEIKAVARPTIATGSIPTRLEIGLTKSGETSPTGRIRLEPTGNSKFYVDSGNIFEIRRGGTSSTQEAISLYNGSTGFNTGSLAFTVRGDGDCENANNAYTGISDVKLKENIVDAESQWDDIRALRVRKYNLKGELGYSTHTQIGLVAQEVELISPGLVGEGTDIDGEGNDLGTVTKSVNYSVLYMKAVKALQEAMERIETLEQRLTDAGI